MIELHKVGVLVSVNVKLGCLLGERRDKAASRFVADHYQANEKRTKTSKYLINRQHPKVKALIAAAQRLREIGYDLSFPWGDLNLRFLPVNVQQEFAARVLAAERDVQNAHAAYLGVYPKLVVEAELTQSGLGLMFDGSQYPPVEVVAELLAVSVQYYPIPQSGHFVADIAAEAANEAKASIERFNVEQTQNAVGHLVNRVDKKLVEYCDKLRRFVKSDKAAGQSGLTFRDSVVGNVEDMAELVRKLNFTGDPAIDKLAFQLERLARVAADSLRDNPDLRQDMIAEGESIRQTLDRFKKIESESDSMVNALADYQ